MFRKICYENKDRLMAGIICGGWDPVDGGQVYSIPLGGALVRQDFAVGGSGSTFIYGLLDKTYRPGMTRDECIDFVREGACEVHGEVRQRWGYFFFFSSC